MIGRVLLVNLGTAAAPEPSAVRDFLSEFLSDPFVVDYPPWIWRPILRKILKSRPERVAEMYRSIWHEEGSPLEVGTRRIADALRAVLGGPVDFAYRYGAPSLQEALEGALADLVLVPLFPQRTGSTTGTIERLVQQSGRSGVRVALIAPDDPGYIQAQAALFEQATAAAPPDHFVVSFHGIPLRYDRAERGLYRRDCETTYRALLARLGWSEARATLAFQSRFGPEPWLKPATATVLERLGKSGVESLAVATPGFLTEGLETAEEIGIRGKETFSSAGGSTFTRVPVVEDHPAFVASLARLVERDTRGNEERNR